MLRFYVFYGSGALPTCASSYLINSSLHCMGWLAGGSPAATHFSLLRQRKVSKRKATRLSGSLRCASGNLRCPRKTGQSGTKSKQPNSRHAHVLFLDATNSIARCTGGAYSNGTFYAQARVFASAFESVPVPDSPVLAGPVMTGKSGIRAARCLSRRRVCADPPFFQSSQVARSAAQGPRQPGRLFFGHFLLAKQKKVTCRRATPGLRTQQSPRPSQKPMIPTGARP
jgi:hypothetical protein